jgi:integrase
MAGWGVPEEMTVGAIDIRLLAGSALRVLKGAGASERTLRVYECTGFGELCRRFETRGVTLRLIYCCGWRPGEARSLPVCAVDLDRGRIDITESKGRKGRQVWMADDLTAYCRNFHAQASRLLPGRSVFFSHSHGNSYTKVWLDKTFRTVRAQAGITAAGEHQPRLYDLRH